MGLNDQSGWADKAYVDARYYDLKNIIANISGGGFTPVPATMASLATADDGIYILTDGNNVGLVVWKLNGKVLPQGSIIVGSVAVAVDYNFADDVINTYYDANSNSVSKFVTSFPFNDSRYVYNDLLQAGGVDFTSETLTSFQRNTIESGAVIVIGSSDATVKNNRILDECSLDISALTSAQTVQRCTIDVGRGNTVTFTKGQSDLTITTENSNYANSFTLTANTIDFNETAGHNWTGLVDVDSTGQINTINGLSAASKFFTLKPSAGKVITINPSASTNILLESGSPTITLDGSKGDFLVLMQDGTNCYQYNLSQFT